jgi:hypothetical protein
MFVQHTKNLLHKQKILASCKWAIKIIFNLYRGQDEKISIAHFLLTCQEKKRKKTKNNQICL